MVKSVLFSLLTVVVLGSTLSAGVPSDSSVTPPPGDASNVSGASAAQSQGAGSQTIEPATAQPGQSPSSSGQPPTMPPPSAMQEAPTADRSAPSEVPQDDSPLMESAGRYPQAVNEWDWSVPPVGRRAYVRAEYLFWTISGDPLPPLVTSSPVGTPAAQAGVLGQPGTTTLFGDQSVNTDGRSGARVAWGWWVNPKARFEVEWFGLGGQRAAFEQSSDGSTILARPFFNLSTGAQASSLIAYPGVAQGGIAVADTSYFNGAAAHLIRNVRFDRTADGGVRRIDGLIGFRYFGLYENLAVNSFSSGPSASIATFDQFRTSDTFYGGSFGLMSSRYRGRWSLVTIGRLGVGDTSQHLHIAGSTTTTSPMTPPETNFGGLLALPSNIGDHVRDFFSLVPQLELKLSFAITPNLRASVGYDALYWSHVIRPGQQINTTVNPTQTSGGPLVGLYGPLPAFHETDIFIQGLSSGLEFRY
jgi:hypothetical protein